jgi:hypothetical protein
MLGVAGRSQPVCVFAADTVRNPHKGALGVGESADLTGGVPSSRSGRGHS